LPQSPAALALFLRTGRLSPFDLALVALYLIGITLFGLRFRKRGDDKGPRSLKSYFLADNTIPWWAISLSIVSAETSTLTIISVPGIAFAGDFGFLQLVLGYMLGRIVVAFLFLPKYFAGQMMTAYQLIDNRFGHTLHKVTAGLFLLTRAAAEGVRVFAVSIVVAIAIGTGDVLSIAIISLLTLLYTFEGGMAAVIWTDVVQMAIYIAGTLVAVWSLGHHIGAGRSAVAGWTTIHQVASAAGKFHMFNFALNLTTTYTFWAGVLGGTFLTMASHGTDQLMVQRMLAARSLRESRLALLSSGVVIFIQFTLFLLIGAGLYVFYSAPSSGPWALNPGPLPSPDRLFPTFIVHELPIGIAGLLVAAILAAAMSNLSAALNSLSSTTVVDFYMRLRPNADGRERNLVSKSSTVLWALVLFAIALYSIKVGGKGHVVEIGLSIASVAYGCLLGVFLLGTLTKFATETGATIGMIVGFALNLWLWLGTFPKTIWQGDLMQCRDSPPSAPGTVSLVGCTVPHITIPHIAFTWYVLIGAAATFLVGALMSLLFRPHKRTPRTPSNRTASGIAAAALLLFLLSSSKGTCFTAQAQQPAPPTAPSEPSTLNPGPSTLNPGPSTYDFTPVTTLMDNAIAAHKLPGAVVVIGHNNHVAFEHAYGNRKLAGEPGLAPLANGSPDLAAEPMTEDTIFDMASLTKCLATATAIMQLYDQHKITSFDDPVEKYLPAFNPQHDETRARVTLRMLLTHTSGEPPDVPLKDPWGLAAPDRNEGFTRALAAPLANTPGAKFVYSDINFILLGKIVETLSGQREDAYVQQHIFAPLGMTETRYLPLDKACGPHKIIGAAIVWAPTPPGHIRYACAPGTWSTSLLARIAPTTHDDESKSDPTANPHFDMLTRGTVHDPTTRRMGGVAGHAGVFSTPHDIALYAQALLDKLLRNTGPFPVSQSTLRLMTMPEQPDPAANPGTTYKPGAPHLDSEMWVSRAAKELAAAQAATNAQIAAGEKGAEPGLAPHYPAIKGQDLRGFGWDIDTAFSKPRGMIFPILGSAGFASFGHTGYTGTTLWIDPNSDTYVVLLANAVHPRGNTPISNLRGQVATAAALALGLYTSGAPGPDSGTRDSTTTPDPLHRRLSDKDESARRAAVKQELKSEYKQWLDGPIVHHLESVEQTLTGIDVLESTRFTALTPYHHLAILTNQAGLDAHGHRTIDILASRTTDNGQLTTIFTPEHGLSATQDTTHQRAEKDQTTNLPVISLYGVHDSDRRPSHAQLKDLDAVVIDLQDAAGTHFWTYESAMGYFLEAASTEQTQFHHPLAIVILDRPNPVGGLAVQGPVSDPDRESYVNFMPLPVRHGMTMGELARYIVATKHLATTLVVVPMQHWQRSEFFAQTGLPWVNPSPNLRSPDAALRYPALGLIESTNISVGRGTDHPFSFFGAGIPPTKPATSTATGGLTDASTSPSPHDQGPVKGTASAVPLNAAGIPGALAPGRSWFHAQEGAAYLNARNLPGVIFTPTTETIAETPDHYPFHGQTIEAVRLTLTDPTIANTPEIGIEILSALHHLYPTQFNLARAMTLVCNQATMDALARGDDPRSIQQAWQPRLTQFKADRAKALLY
jgi:SSS family transporter